MMVCVCFVLAFAAGACAGVLVHRSASGSRRGSLLSRELRLTEEQQGQMRQIWSEVMRAEGEQPGQRGHELRRERDEAIRALLTEEQTRQYAQLMEEYARKSDELSQKRRELYEKAVEKTKQILTEQQRRKYEELLGRRVSGRRPSNRGGEPGRAARSQPRQGDEE